VRFLIDKIVSNCFWLIYVVIRRLNYAFVTKLLIKTLYFWGVKFTIVRQQPVIAFKKPTYPVSKALYDYLTEYGRNIIIPLFYDDLLRFTGSVEVFDKNDNDTLWIRVIYPDHERENIDMNLKKIYTIMHSDGSDYSIPNLNIDAIDYCTFGNSRPFRVKIRNILNDNYTYLYVKKADASRIYGLELEELLSPNKVDFLVHKDTLIEEHILGIPGDIFIEEHLPHLTEREQKQISKEFVKFNERCLIRLLGDMRSYNYVFVASHDFDQVQYRIRAIDFDQQSYEGSLKIYLPQFFKENNTLVKMVEKSLLPESIIQYKNEERSLLAKRAKASHSRLQKLVACMMSDTLSKPAKVAQLRREIKEFTKDVNFKKAQSMGEILKYALDFVVRNYQNVNPYIIS